MFTLFWKGQIRRGFALGNWTFQPSQIDGKPVALIVMMGIRLVTH